MSVPNSKQDIPMNDSKVNTESVQGGIGAKRHHENDKLSLGEKPKLSLESRLENTETAQERGDRFEQMYNDVLNQAMEARKELDSERTKGKMLAKKHEELQAKLEELQAKIKE